MVGPLAEEPFCSFPYYLLGARTDSVTVLLILGPDPQFNLASDPQLWFKEHVNYVKDIIKKHIFTVGKLAKNRTKIYSTYYILHVYITIRTLVIKYLD